MKRNRVYDNSPVGIVSVCNINKEEVKNLNIDDVVNNKYSKIILTKNYTSSHLYESFMENILEEHTKEAPTFLKVLKDTHVYGVTNKERLVSNTTICSNNIVTGLIKNLYHFGYNFIL